MTSSQKPFTRSALCPVVNKQVDLTGTVISLQGAGPAVVGQKNCSNIVNCLKAYKSLDAVPRCLLHSLRK
jgi:hypothetical protein